MNFRKMTISQILLIFIAFSLNGLYAAKTPIGTLTKIKGEVSIRHPLKKSITPIDGEVVFTGTKIKTAKDSSLILTFKDDTELEIGSDTLFRVKSKSENSKSAKLELFGGLMRTKVHKLSKKDTFTIKTPSAVAGVRGTVFDMLVSPRGGTMVQCFSTENLGVQVRTPTGGTEMVGAGFRARVSSNGGIQMSRVQSRGTAVRTATKAGPKSSSKSSSKTPTKAGPKESKSSNENSNSSEAPPSLNSVAEENENFLSEPEGTDLDLPFSPEIESIPPIPEEPPNEPTVLEDLANETKKVNINLNIESGN